MARFLPSIASLFHTSLPSPPCQTLGPVEGRVHFGESWFCLTSTETPYKLVAFLISPFSISSTAYVHVSNIPIFHLSKAYSSIKYYFDPILLYVITLVLELCYYSYYYLHGIVNAIMCWDVFEAHVLYLLSICLSIYVSIYLLSTSLLSLHLSILDLSFFVQKFYF